MEDSSLSETEVENKGMSARTEPVEMSVGFSPSSEVNTASFPGFFLFASLWSTFVHSYIFLSLLRFGPGTLLKCPPLLPLSLWFVRREWMSLFLSLSLHSPPHSLTPSLSPHLWLDILIPPFNGRHLSADSCLELRPPLHARFPTILSLLLSIPVILIVMNAFY